MLIATIILAIVFMFALPLALALVLTRRYQATWRTLGVGVLAYLVTQSVMLLIVQGIQMGLQNQLTTVIAGLPLSTLLLYALAWIACILTVVSLWIGLRYLKGEANSWIGALALGLGFGGTESLLIGIQWVTGLYQPIAAALFGVQSLGLSSSDAATLTTSLNTLLTTPWYYPLTNILDRTAYVTVYLAVAVAVWQALKRPKWTWLWLVGGMVWLIIVQTLNSVVATISVNSYWTELYLFVVMLVSLEAMYWYKVSVLDKQPKDTVKSETPEAIEAGAAEGAETVEPAGKPKPRKAKKKK